MHRENWSEGHLSNFRCALQLILSSALKFTLAMIHLAVQSAENLTWGAWPLVGEKEAKVRGQPTFLTPIPRLIPPLPLPPHCTTSPPLTLYLICGEKSNKSTGGCLLTSLLMLTPPPLPLQIAPHSTLSPPL